MIALKKLYGDELLRLALVLSLLKSDPNDYLERETQQLLAGLHISNGSDWSFEQEAQTLIRPRFVHPKSIDHVLENYHRQVFEELHSLGRYGGSLEYNDRILNNRPILHTYLVNNVATDTVAPGLASASVPEESQDGVSADDNVAQEVKITDDDSQSQESEDAVQPDAVVTLSAGFFSNYTGTDVFQEIATRTFDVNEFLLPSDGMQIKKEADSNESDRLNINIKKERENEDLYSDNAMDDYVSYFTVKSEKLDVGEPDSVLHQNMADLQDYDELFNDVKQMKNEFEYLDVKQQQENLEQYLLENTPLDAEAYELAPILSEEFVLDVKRERASTSFTSASSSGVSDMDVSSVKEMSDVKMELLESDEGHHTGDELTQEVSSMRF
ncbi:Uncharacterized protein OBRU01_05123 [Operophtera brumata]|uniref:Uncharacterized protein n=1 Tax=Operophtera brumata TaxID=104452 RepID=A0A0L7LN10_OPEBR|nr:Uncharacterized protein OBRU01_05123 [Operophtera brumata]